MNDLGLEYVTDTSDFEALRTQIYEYYEVAGILNAPHRDYDFPEPLWVADIEQPRDVASLNMNDDKGQLFRHMIHPDAKALLPFVDAVLAANAYLHTDRESIAQIVDRAYHLAKAAGITPCPDAKTLLNMLILAELLAWQDKAVDTPLHNLL